MWDDLSEEGKIIYIKKSNNKNDIQYIRKKRERYDGYGFTYFAKMKKDEIISNNPDI